MRRLLSFFALTATPLVAQTTPSVAADTFVPRDAQVIPLWPRGAPGAIGDSTIDRPTLSVFRAPRDRATGAAAIVFPGGGYGHIATGKEGVATAHWLNSVGVTAFVATYRLGPRYHHPAMRDDGLRAVRVVRARAAEWGIDPRRIGVVGFSAGGHLASTIGTHYGDADAARADVADTASARPDFLVLVYPVITLEDPLAHKGSRTNLLGTSPDTSLVRALSNETRVTAETPATFLVATTDDGTVPVENALMFYSALHAAKVPVELHIFEHGRHGFGTATGDPLLAQWMTLCAGWLSRRGLATTTSR